jgi:hypothetical protein
MARSYAPLFTSIWGDPDFCRLTADAQRAYMLAFSQPTISWAGVVAYTTKRWAAMAADTTPAQLDAAFDELATHRFVVIDDVTEEVWVRDFVDANAVLAQPQLRKAMAKAYDSILSPGIRRAFYDELPADGKALITSPPEPCPKAPASLDEGSVKGCSQTQGQGLQDLDLDLDLDQNLNLESDPSAQAPTSSHTLLAPGRPPALNDELADHVQALVDIHGPDAVDAAVQILVDDRRRFQWPKDARRAIELVLGDPPAKTRPHPLDDAQRAQLETAANGLDTVRRTLADAEPDPDKRKDFIAAQRAARSNQ